MLSGVHPRNSADWRMDLCDVALPYTLIGVLLWPPPRHPGAVACAGRFLRDYASRATNALLWIALISVTTLLFRRLARLVWLWVQGSRIPGPPSTPFLALIPGYGSLGNLSGRVWCFFEFFFLFLLGCKFRSCGILSIVKFSLLALGFAFWERGDYYCWFTHFTSFD